MDFDDMGDLSVRFTQPKLNEELGGTDRQTGPSLSLKAYIDDLIIMVRLRMF